MTRSYSLFVASNELYQNPYVRQFSTLHDVILQPGKSTSVHFLLQQKVYPYQLEQLFITYNPDILDITNIQTELHTNQTIVHATLTAHQTGSMHIEMSLPSSANTLQRTSVGVSHKSLIGFPYFVDSRLYA